MESRFKKIVEDIYKSIFYGNVESAKAIGVDHKVEDADVMYEQEKIKAIIELGECLTYLMCVMGKFTLCSWIIGIRERDTFIVNNLTKVSRYHKILDHIYFKVSEGSVVGLLGECESGSVADLDTAALLLLETKMRLFVLFQAPRNPEKKK